MYIEYLFLSSGERRAIPLGGGAGQSLVLGYPHKLTLHHMDLAHLYVYRVPFFVLERAACPTARWRNWPASGLAGQRWVRVNPIYISIYIYIYIYRVDSYTTGTSDDSTRVTPTPLKASGVPYRSMEELARVWFGWAEMELTRTTCLSNFLPACLSAYLPACLPTYLLAYLFACLPTYLPAC